MAETFGETSVTLLERIAAERTGEDEAAWARFFALYQPAMLAFARGIGDAESAEDAVQGVMIKLVGILRRGRYERQDGKSFRSYLKTLVRNQLRDLYRREVARGRGQKRELTPDIADSVADAVREPGERIDAEWSAACRRAAVDHVLNRAAIGDRARGIYRDHVLGGEDAASVAKRYGVTRCAVRQVKSRLERMIGAVMSEYGD